LELVKIYADEGFSGKKKDRPQLTVLLKEATQNKFDYVVCARLTRFGRSTRDLLNNLSILEENGIRFISLKEAMDTSTPAGRLLRTVLAGIAEFEHETIKDQMLSNRYARAKRGDIIIGKPPFGYRWNKEKKCIEADPQEAEIYRRIVEMYLAGASYKDIAIALRREGIKAKLKPFSATVIGRVLKNPAYYTGRLLRNTHKFSGNRKTNEKKPNEQHYELDVPPLIDKITWDRLQDRIAFNKVKTKRTTNPNFWLRNVLVCGECGGRVKPKSVRGRFCYYGCYWSRASSKELEAAGKRQKCRLPSIPAHQLENVVMGQVLNFLTMGGFFIGDKYHSAPLEKMLGPQRYDAQIKELEGQLNQMKKALGRKENGRDSLFAMLEEEGVDRNLFLLQVEKFGAEIRTLEAHIGEAERKLADLEKGKASHRNLIDFVRGNTKWLSSIATKIAGLEPEKKQKLIETVMDGDKIEVVGGPEPGDEGYFDDEDYSKVWSVNPPLFSFNPNVFDSIKFDNVYLHAGAGKSGLRV
jgi:DNA invertase Pin-like site-specific DNA recombinase